MSNHRDYSNTQIPVDAVIAVRAVIGNNCSEEMAADALAAAMPHLYRGLQLALRSATTEIEQLRFRPRTSGSRKG